MQSTAEQDGPDPPRGAVISPGNARGVCSDGTLCTSPITLRPSRSSVSQQFRPMKDARGPALKASRSECEDEAGVREIMCRPLGSAQALQCVVKSKLKDELSADSQPRALALGRRSHLTEQPPDTRASA